MAGEIQRMYSGKTGIQKKTAAQDLNTRIVRVAAYCRVSTTKDIQMNSLENQMAIFRKKIAERPGWQLAGVYADEGLSGTRVKNRREFMRMVSDCEAGKIDYIITKGIARFARNTVECLSYVRKFQAMGIQVLFEKENLDTSSVISEMLLTVLAAFAQEESRSISENLKWGLRKRHEQGIMRWSKLFGYRNGADGEHLIEEAEAQVVRDVFDMALHGESTRDIANKLNDAAIPSPNGKKWTHTSVNQLLNNERYAGDVLLQKWIITDFISHKAVRNDQTEVAAYYVSDHHEAIIDRDTFNWVRRSRELKTQVPGESLQYPYADTEMNCPLCGSPLVQRQTRSHSGRMVWGCFAKGGCRGYALKTRILDEAMLECYRTAEAADGPLAQYKEKEAEQETVEYFWLAALVERIELHLDDSLTVHWRGGQESRAALQIGDYRNGPIYTAQKYCEYIDRLQKGDYVPAKPTTPEARSMDRAKRRPEPGGAEAAGSANILETADR